MAEIVTECLITDVEVGQAIKKQFCGEQFEMIDYDIKPASKEPLGFMGDHVRICVNLKLNGKPHQAIFFAKKIPTSVKSHRDYAEATRAYYKEIELYKTLFVDIDNAVGTEAKWRPVCLATRDYDLLICQDLAQQGFYMLPERTLMPLNNVKMTIRAMASMHAGSIIFEEKLNSGLCKTLSPNFDPTSKKHTIRDLYPNLIFESECTDQEGHPGYSFWEAGIMAQIAVLDELEIYTQEEKTKIKKKYADTVRRVYRMLEPSDKYRNVMIHADLWGNNVIFRDGSEGELKEAVTVDFQMMRYAPPAQDLLMLLHIVQDKPFRDTHEQHLKELYYECLAGELLDHHLDIKGLLPRQEFDDSCLFYKRYAVLNQLIYTQLSITPPEICGKFIATSQEYERIMYEDRCDIVVESFHKDQLCKERATESIVELVDLFNLLS